MALWLIALLLLLAAPAEPSGEPDLLPLPRPDLTRMEEEIRRQIEALSGLIEERAGEQNQEAAASLAEAYGTLGQLYHLYDLREAAAVCYRNARALAPAELGWPYYLALLHASAGDSAVAREHFGVVLELSPEHLPSLVRLGEIELADGDADGALGLFHRALVVDSRTAAAHFGAGKALAARGDFASAIEAFKRALALQPGATIVHYPLALAYRRLGDLDRARHHLEQRGLREVDLHDPWFQRLGEMSTLASFRLLRGLAAKSEGFSSSELMGYALSLLARVEGAPEQLEQLLATWPAAQLATSAAERGRLHYALGGLLVHRGRDDEATRHFRSAVALAPSLLDARIKLANVRARHGAFADAVAQLSIALERQPSLSDARLKRAAALSAMNRPREALRDLERLVTELPENPEVRFRAGAAKEALDRAPEAVDDYLAAARLETTAEQKAAAHYRAGEVLQRLGALERARGQYQEALAERPDFDPARRALADLRASSSPSGML